MKNTIQAKANEQTAYRYKKIKDYVYDMQTVLGKGNFSTVYRGRNQGKNQEIAVKVVKLTSLTFQKLEELLEQEIIITRILDHPNTIRCYEVLKSVNHCYFITQLCQGGTLEKMLKRKGRLTEDEAWPYIRDIYQGLKYLNSKNIIHRDIKAANIFLKNGVAKIADFGFAIQTKQHFKDINIGSPLYMSPEGLCDNIYGPKTDVWAFGLVLYELLHGNAPFAHAVTQVQLQNLLKKQLKFQQLRPDLSLDMKQLLLRCLQVDEQKRISMQQIQWVSYMQNHVRPKIMSSINLNNARYKRLSVPNGNMLFVPPQNFYKTCIKRIDTTFQNKENVRSRNDTTFESKGNLRSRNDITFENKGNLSSRNDIQCEKSCSVKIIPITKRISKFPSDQIESNTSITLDYRERDVIIASITFNQAIGLIHYCRIGFKLAQQKISADLKKWIKSLILMILQELKIKVNSDQILYVDDQNRERKESKLKLVVGEYLIKYSKELQGQKTQIVLPHLQDSLRKNLIQLQRGKEQNLSIIYLAMLFSIFTESLMKSIQTKEYRFFGENGIVDTSLEAKNVPITFEAYYCSKKIYQLHYESMFCSVNK